MNWNKEFNVTTEQVYKELKQIYKETYATQYNDYGKAVNNQTLTRKDVVG